MHRPIGHSSLIFGKRMKLILFIFFFFTGNQSQKYSHHSWRVKTNMVQNSCGKNDGSRYSVETPATVLCGHFIDTAYILQWTGMETRQLFTFCSDCWRLINLRRKRGRGQLPFSLATSWRTRTFGRWAADNRAAPSSFLRSLHTTIRVNSPPLEHGAQEFVVFCCHGGRTLCCSPLLHLSLLTAQVSSMKKLSWAVNSSPWSHVKPCKTNQRDISLPQVRNMNGVISMWMS